MTRPDRRQVRSSKPQKHTRGFARRCGSLPNRRRTTVPFPATFARVLSVLARKIAWKLGHRPRPLHSVRISGFDPEDESIADRVNGYTMTSKLKRNALIAAVRYIHERGIPGSIVECGVWKGGSMMAAAYTLIELGEPERNLYLFDTFEGMPPPSDIDVRADNTSAAHLLATTGQDDAFWAVGPLETVRAAMTSTAYPSELIHYIVGRVEDTLPEEAPQQIALLRLDTDWYESTRHELVHMYDRLVPGGVLIIDDYGYWKGSRQAVDEFFSTRPRPLLIPLDDGGRLVIKND